MATTQYSRVKVATSTTGTGSYTLGAAVASFRSFSVVTNGATVSYLAEFGTDYEVGVGTFSSPSTLARTTIIISSNSNNAVNWSSPPIISLTPNERDIQSGSNADQLVRLDGTGKILPSALPNPAASTLGGVKSKAAVANTYLTGIDTDGTPLTGTVPLSSDGTAGIVYSKTATTHQFLNALGTDGVFTSAQPAFSDLTGQASAAQLPNPAATTLGGVKSYAAVTNQFLTSIGTDGTPVSAQPSFSNISGTPSVSQASSGSWVLLNTLTASGSASLTDTTSFTASHVEYELVFENLLPASANQTMQLEVHSGGTYQTSSYISNGLNFWASGTNTLSATAYIQLGYLNYQQNIAPGVNGQIRVKSPSGTGSNKVWHGNFAFMAAAGTFMVSQPVGFWNGGTGAITGFRIRMSSGNLTSGVVRVYGRVA